VGLARALVNDPDILLMDEAFSALDPMIKGEMQDQLLELQRKLQKTIVFISHDLDEALKIGDRISILKDGELVQDGTPSDILMRPATAYVEEFISGVNRSKAIRVSHVLRAVASARVSGDESYSPQNVDLSKAARLGQSIEDVMPQLMNGAQTVPVVNEANSLVGYLDKSDVIAALYRTAASKV
jgi:glycine betaine/proline transport system ATP-binding protein